jgi:K+-sensing histidine kinase KdpD
MGRVKVIARSPATGYAAALAVPVAITYGVTQLNMPSFVFEHLVVLLVLGVAIPWGLGAASSPLSSVLSDNVLLTEPIGRPTITGVRDVIDLALFATVAVVFSGLTRRAHTARLAAKVAAERELQAREDQDRLIATIKDDLATPLIDAAAADGSGAIVSVRLPVASQHVRQTDRGASEQTVRGGVPT